MDTLACLHWYHRSKESLFTILSQTEKGYEQSRSLVISLPTELSALWQSLSCALYELNFQGYPVTQLTTTQQTLLQDLREFGLVYQRKVNLLHIQLMTPEFITLVLSNEICYQFILISRGFQGSSKWRIYCTWVQLPSLCLYLLQFANSSVKSVCANEVQFSLKVLILQIPAS